MAGEIQEWFEGFAHRGRPPWSDQPSGSHVEIGRYVEDGRGGREVLASLTLTPEQAEAAGWSLDKVIPGLNARALVERDAAIADAAAARQERDALVTERDALAAQLAALQPASGPAAVVSRTQFFKALAAAGAISQAEALAVLKTGDLPARLEAAIDVLPSTAQMDARIDLAGRASFDRGYPLVAQLGAALGYDDAALDALWTAAAAL